MGVFDEAMVETFATVGQAAPVAKTAVAVSPTWRKAKSLTLKICRNKYRQYVKKGGKPVGFRKWFRDNAGEIFTNAEGAPTAFVRAIAGDPTALRARYAEEQEARQARRASYRKNAKAAAPSKETKEAKRR